MRYHYIPIIPTVMLKSKANAVLNAGKNVEQQLPLFIALGNAKWHSHFGRQLSNFLPS